MNPYNNQQIEPKKFILHDLDRKLMIINALDDNKRLFLMDIETSKIIQELRGDNENRIKDISSMYKSTESNDNPCVITINKRNIF